MIVNIAVFGDSGTGKSAITLRFCDGNWVPSIDSTIGSDFGVRVIEVDGSSVRLHIWDCAGAQRYRTIMPAYYRGAMGVMFVFDVTDTSSFENIASWYTELANHPSNCKARILIGNKLDCADRRAVTYDQGFQLASRLGMHYMEVSAKDDIRIGDAFLSLVSIIRAQSSDR